MSTLPVRCITTIGDEITIDAALLAPELGLSTEVLKAEMGKGLVYCVAEKGTEEDLGRMRLTFRYRARSWTVIVEPGGVLMKAQPDDTEERVGASALADQAS